jgi:hypothetical protein
MMAFGTLARHGQLCVGRCGMLSARPRGGNRLDPNVLAMWPRCGLGAALALAAALLTSSAWAADTQTPQGEPTRPFEANASVAVDPVGFALFGPTVSVELGLGRFSALAYGRWLNPGALARSMFLEDDYHEFGFSCGLGLKGRYYFQSGLVGPHVGLAFEYIHTRIEETKYQLIATMAEMLVPEIEGGYRIGFGRFFLGATAGVGYAFMVGSSVENIMGGTDAHLYTVSDESRVYGSAGIDIGVLF